MKHKRKIIKTFLMIIALFIIIGLTTENAYAGFSDCGNCDTKCTSCGGDGKKTENCSTCKGKGTIDNREDCTAGCTGGNVSCPKTQTCSNCSGAGGYHAEDCAKCKGTGFIQINQNKQIICLFKTTCSKCSGTGSITCSKCNGTGWYKCSTCGGGGYTGGYEDCSKCDGGTITVNCKNCGGDGIVGLKHEDCTACEGDGKIWRGDCSTIAYDAQKNPYKAQGKSPCACDESGSYTAAIRESCSGTQCADSCQGHSWDFNGRIIPPISNRTAHNPTSCTSDGYYTAWQTVYCSNNNCNASFSGDMNAGTIPAPGHSYAKTKETSYAYSEYNSTHHWNVCQTVWNGKECGAKNSTPHTYGSWISYGDGTVTKEPTCTTKGTLTTGSYRVCSGCGYVDKNSVDTPIPELGHDWNEDYTLYSTTQHYVTCANGCGTKNYGSHSWGNYKSEYEYSRYSTKDPTCTTTGNDFVTFRTPKQCTQCDYNYYDQRTENQTSSILGHEMSKWKSNNDGTHSTTCARCNHTHKENCTIADWHNTGKGYEENGEAVIFFTLYPSLLMCSQGTQPQPAPVASGARA